MSEDPSYSAALRPRSDVGTMSVTVKKRAEPKSKQKPAESTEHEQMQARGFKLERRAWRRR